MNQNNLPNYKLLSKHDWIIVFIPIIIVLISLVLIWYIQQNSQSSSSDNFLTSSPSAYSNKTNIPIFEGMTAYVSSAGDDAEYFQLKGESKTEKMYMYYKYWVALKAFDYNETINLDRSWNIVIKGDTINYISGYYQDGTNILRIQ